MMFSADSTLYHASSIAVLSYALLIVTCTNYKAFTLIWLQKWKYTFKGKFREIWTLAQFQSMLNYITYTNITVIGLTYYIVNLRCHIKKEQMTVLPKSPINQ